MIIGKGAAYARVEDLLKQLVDLTGIPYLPMSMGKGTLPDADPNSAMACRSTIMEQADVVILAGARLNWLLSRGHGKWSPDTKFIQLDIDPRKSTSTARLRRPWWATSAARCRLR